MTLNKQTNWGGLSYESPSVTTLEILSEGVFCASYRYSVGGAGTFEDDEVIEYAGY